MERTSLWADLPCACLSILATKLNDRDTAAARLVCPAWAAAITPSTIHLTALHGYSQLQQPLSLLQPGSCYNLVSGCHVTLGTCLASDSALVQLGSALSALPQLTTLNIRTAASHPLIALSRSSSSSSSSSSSQLRQPPAGSASSEGAGASSESEMDIPTLPFSLLLSHLGHKLKSLSLSCHQWPSGLELGPLLLHLPLLHTLALHHCPLSTLSSLPALPTLKQLSYTGVLGEWYPCPPGPAEGSFFPPLLGLTKLVLKGIPVDLRIQELEDINSGSGRQCVGCSIACSCPNLLDLRSDMELGSAVAALTRLTALQGAHPTFLRAAAPATAAAGEVEGSCTGPFAAAGSGRGVEGPRRGPHQQQQLLHLGVGLDIREDCLLLSQFTGLQSLMVWPSSSRTTRRSQVQTVAATAGAEPSSSSSSSRGGTSSSSSRVMGAVVESMFGLPQWSILRAFSSTRIGVLPQISSSRGGSKDQQSSSSSSSSSDSPPNGSPPGTGPSGPEPCRSLRRLASLSSLLATAGTALYSLLPRSSSGSSSGSMGCCCEAVPDANQGPSMQLVLSQGLGGHLIRLRFHSPWVMSKGEQEYVQGSCPKLRDFLVVNSP